MSIHDELLKIADVLGGEHGEHAVALRKMAGEISAMADSKPRAHAHRQLTLVEAVNAAASDNATLRRLANLRIRCARLGLDLDQTAASPLKISQVDAAFSKATSPADKSEIWSLKSSLFRDGLLSASGV
jgi:hypothetical protein